MRSVGRRSYFIVDIGLNFNTTYVDSETAQLVRKPAMIKANCARAPTLCRSAALPAASAALLLRFCCRPLSEPGAAGLQI